MANRSLAAAKRAKFNEYYTQWIDIEREVNAYLEYNPDTFRGKTVLLPCDDPEWSNFTKFFVLHFKTLGLKRLISTSYAPSSNREGSFYRPTLFETQAPNYDPEKSLERGRIFVLDGSDLNRDGKIDIEDLQWDYLEGDGDFRSPEVTALREEADIVVTNPPFSLFRDFVAWLYEGDVHFSIIGTNSAITYKDVFTLIKQDRLWLGATGYDNDMVFAVPKGTPIKDADREKARRMGYTPDERFDYTRMGNSCWFTNLEHGRRHEPLTMMTMSDNQRYSRRADIREHGYRRYDNFDAIEVPWVEAIPSDYPGMMGVPVSFLTRYNPDQFEVLFSADDMDQTREFGVEPLGEKRVADYYAAGGTGSNSAGHRKLFLYEPRPHVPFKRVVIRRRVEGVSS